MNGSTEHASPSIPSASAPAYSAATLAVHGDDALNSSTDVAPALHVSTTFRYKENPGELVPVSDYELANGEPGAPPTSDSYIYSRLAAPNTSRLEAILSKLIGAPSLTYSSGLSAFHALLVWTHPSIVAIGDGYHGCHGVLKIYQKLTNCRIVDVHDPSSWSGKDEDGKSWALGKGDLVHLETPLNPTGEAYEIEKYAGWAHERGAVLSVDATFAPPPLQDPFAWGADFVMHSGTKYFGGHSDMLCGVISVGKKREGWEKDYWGMFQERLFLGAVMGSMEGWLGVRSLRTLELRVVRQSQNAEKIVQWLHGLVSGDNGDADAELVKKTVERVQHSSLQVKQNSWIEKQMPNGHGPVFAIWMKDQELAKRLPSKLHLFNHATSLGGVESLIEWRRMSDDTVDPRVLRVSVGVENWEDLKEDLRSAFKALLDSK